MARIVQQHLYSNVGLKTSWIPCERALTEHGRKLNAVKPVRLCSYRTRLVVFLASVVVVVRLAIVPDVFDVGLPHSGACGLAVNVAGWERVCPVARFGGIRHRERVGRVRRGGRGR